MKKKMGTLKREATSSRAIRWMLAVWFMRYCEPTWMAMTPIIAMPRMYSMAGRRGFLFFAGAAARDSCSVKRKTPYFLCCGLNWLCQLVQSLRMKSMWTLAVRERLPGAIGVAASLATAMSMLPPKRRVSM